MRPKGHCALKNIFSMEKGKLYFLKKIENFSNFRKFAKLFFFDPKKSKKYIKKNFFCWRLRRLGMFGAFDDFGALFFLYIRKMKNTPKKWVCAVSRRSKEGANYVPPPRHRDGTGLNFSFPHNPFRRIPPNFGIAGDRFLQQLQSKLWPQKRTTT